jgi:glycerol uptake facilitator protein
MRHGLDFIGEFIGTFLMILFGLGAGMASGLFGAHSGLFQIALLWGFGVTIAIYATRHLSCAHFNPAVSIAMVIGRRMPASQLPVYIAAQFLGAFAAAALLYLLFGDSFVQFEALHHIVRGTPESVKTAMMFGEFYPSPGAAPVAVVTQGIAFLTEAVGTFVLIFLVFSLTEGCNVGRPDDALAPLFIGFIVALLISFIAPLTQAGFNPARDLSPRLFSMLAGWGRAALPDATGGFITVYVLGPICGGAAAALLFSRVIGPLMHRKNAGIAADGAEREPR